MLIYDVDFKRASKKLTRKAVVDTNRRCTLSCRCMA